MNRNYFKPRFKIQRTYTQDGKPNFFIVKVMYWWFPVWMPALKQIYENGGKTTTSEAVFNSEEDALDYIVRRYSVIRSSNYEESRQD